MPPPEPHAVSAAHPDLYFDDPELPLPTPLYGLAPLSDDSGQVESLRNYIARLAEEHCLNLRRFLVQAVGHVPGFGQNIEYLVMSMRPRVPAPVTFGLKSSTQELASTLQRMTGRGDLIGCTLVPLRGLITSEGLYAKSAHHCAECFAEDERQGREPFERLIWLIAPVKACPVHGTRLVESHCGGVTTTRRQLGKHPGTCWKCGARGFGCRTEESEVASEAELWTARQVASLLTGQTPFDADETQLRIKSAIHAYAKTAPLGIAGMARRAGLAKTSLWTWLNRPHSQTSLDALLALCRNHGWKIADLVAGRLGETSTKSTSADGSQRRRRRNAIDHDAIRRRMEEAITDSTPASLAELATELGVDRRLLSTRHSDLATQVLGSREWRLEWKQELELEAIREEVVMVLLQLLAAGTTITERNINALGFRRWGRGTRRGNLLALVATELGLPAFAPTYRGTKLTKLQSLVQPCADEVRRRLDGAPSGAFDLWTDEIDEAQREWDLDVPESELPIAYEISDS